MQSVAAVKDGFVKQDDSCANPARLRSVLREMAYALGDRKLWLTIAAVVLLVAVAGPFYTLEHLGLAGRIAYWETVGVLSWLMMWGLVRVALALHPIPGPAP